MTNTAVDYPSSDEDSYELIGSPEPSVVKRRNVKKAKPVVGATITEEAKSTDASDDQEKKEEDAVPAEDQKDERDDVEVTEDSEKTKKRKKKAKKSTKDLIKGIIVDFLRGLFGILFALTLGYLSLVIFAQLIVPSILLFSRYLRGAEVSIDLTPPANTFLEKFHPPTPSLFDINGFSMGDRIRIVGMAKPNARRFSIDLEKDEDIAFHFNPRFYQDRVVRNHAVKGQWNFDKEEIHGYFPFKLDEVFTVEFISTESIAGHKRMVKVLVNGKEYTNFVERALRFTDVAKLTIRGDVTIHSVQVLKK